MPKNVPFWLRQSASLPQSGGRQITIKYVCNFPPERSALMSFSHARARMRALSCGQPWHGHVVAIAPQLSPPPLTPTQKQTLSFWHKREMKPSLRDTRSTFATATRAATTHAHPLASANISCARAPLWPLFGSRRPVAQRVLTHALAVSALHK